MILDAEVQLDSTKGVVFVRKVIPTYKPDLGAVVVLVMSPTRVLLVMNEKYRPPRWKPVTGGVEAWDRGPVNAAIRETRQEGGIELLPRQLRLVRRQPIGNGKELYFFIARVSEAKMDTYKPVGRESEGPIRARAFAREVVPSLRQILAHRREFILEAIR